MRRFVLNRSQDVTGISGTGVILNGVEHIPGGLCSVYWPKYGTTGQYPSMKVLEAIHCYNGNAVVEWLDNPDRNCEYCDNADAYEMNEMDQGQRTGNVTAICKDCWYSGVQLVFHEPHQ